MAQYVDVPDMGTIEFPDDMSPSDMENAIKSYLQENNTAPQKPSFMSSVADKMNFLGGVIQNRLNQNTHNVMSGGMPGLNGNTPQINGVQRGEDPGAFMAPVIALNNGVEQVAQGLWQPLLESDSLTNATGINFKQKSKDYAAAREAAAENAAYYHPTSAGIANFVGNAGAQLPLMAGFEAAVPAKSFLTARPNLSNAIQGGISGATQYVDEGGSRAKNTLFGGVLNMAIPYGLNKTANSFMGNFDDPAAKEILDLGQKWNVPTYASDAANTPKLNATAEILEEVPFLGMRGPRQAQMNSQKAAASNLNNRMGEIVDETPYGGRTGLRMIQEAAQSGGNRADAANDVLRSIRTAGNDVNNVIKASGEVQTLRKKLIADQKYDRVQQVADKFGKIDTKKVVDDIGNSIIQAQNSALPDESTINTLTKLRNNLSSKELNYSGLRNTLSDVKSAIRDYYTGKNALIGESGVGYLQAAKKSIQSTLDNFAKSNGPNLKALWQDADSFYKNSVVPLKNAQIASTLKNEADPDKIYSTFITNSSARETGKPNRLYNSLDNKGRAAVRYGMVDEAFNAAYNPETKNFSSASFDTALNKKMGAYNVFFKGADKAEIDGFKNLMRHTQRASIALNKPETGVKNIAPIITGGAAIGTLIAPVAVAKTAAGALLTRALLTTSAGKRILLASSRTPPGSPAMQKYYEQALGLISRGLTGEFANRENQKHKTFNANNQELQSQLNQYGQ